LKFKAGDYVSKQDKVLGKLNTVIGETVSNIDQYVVHPGHDLVRHRKCDAETLIRTTIGMKGGSLSSELQDMFPNKSERMVVSAYEQAKAKLKPDAYKHIFEEFNKTPKCYNYYKNHRIFAIDGSDFNLPYNSKSVYALDKPYGRPRNDGTENKHSSQIHGNFIFDCTNRLFTDVEFQPRSQMDERSAAITLLKRMNLNEDYIVTMDRGYDSFNMFEHCNRIPHCKFVIRAKVGKSTSSGVIKEIASLPDKECDKTIQFKVSTSSAFCREHPEYHYINAHKHKEGKEISKTTKYAKWDFEKECTITVRVCKFQINEEGSDKPVWEVLVTNLDRFHFPLREMKKLYHYRWRVEVGFRELKYSLGAVQFHSKKDDFILQELYAHLIMYNTVSMAINCVKIVQDKKYPHAINFKMAVQIVRRYFRLKNNDPPDAMYDDIGSYTVPIREGRSDKRNLRAKGSVWFVYRVAA